MKPRREKASLLLLLLFPMLLSSTACITWQPVTGFPLPAKIVEQVADHPSTTIRILAPDVPRLMVDSPSVEDDQLVGVVGGQLFSTPLAEITMLEVRKLDVGKTLTTLATGGLGYMAIVVLLIIDAEGW